MDSYTYMFLNEEEEGEEVVSSGVNFLIRAMVFIRNRRQANRPTRILLYRDRYGAHYRLVVAFLREPDTLSWSECVHLLEAVASQDLWIWHAFFDVAGSNKDINVLYQSPLFNDLKTRQAPKIPFVAYDITYPCGYYLVNGIYPELVTLVKTIPEPVDDDNK
nr:protein ALP1-like isoform X1 [Tanacetum cinerariifolium]